MMNSTKLLAALERKKQLMLGARIDSVDEELNTIINMADYTLSEDTRRQLLGFSYTRFPEWDGNTSTQRVKGKVVVTEEIKWLINNNGVIDPNPLLSGLTTPFRSTNEFDEDGTKRYWMEKEFCITGMHLWFSNEKRYVVKPRGDGGSLATDSATPPPNNTNEWEEDPL